MKYIAGKRKKQLSVDDQKSEYKDLTPTDSIQNGDEYLNALGWALNNSRVKNIALAGPYGAGKSSIIETYLKRNPQIKEKSLQISMATFAESELDKDREIQKINIGQDEIESGILKQLFYKVDYKKIPQSRYRKLHKTDWKYIWIILVGLITLMTLMAYIFLPGIASSAKEKIVDAGTAINLSAVVSLLLFGILVLGILLIIARLCRSILSRYRVKEIKLPMDATVKSADGTNENIFDKNMDEIFYFFEETKYRIIFFEDLDRLDNSSIFVHLRELNTLLNNYNTIKEPIIFIYAVKDDIFSATDRTKFFDFIIPVIPILNSTNSGEALLEQLQNSDKLGITHQISQGFMLDVAPYISDMRILQNTYNEFIVYKKTLRTDQELKLLDEPMMALLIFKNTYPYHFANIQNESGIIKQAFIDKQNYIKQGQKAIQNDIDKVTEDLIEIRSETLINIKELKSALLCEITNWMGIPNRVTINGYITSLDDFMMDDFNLLEWENVNVCSGTYRNWAGNGNYNFSCTSFSEIYTSFLKRVKRLDSNQESHIVEKQEHVEKLKLHLQNISSWSLQQLIEQFNVEKILSDEIIKNKLLVFLLRRGYIDEQYANYINYFKGNSITRDDMNFILSIKNLEQQPFNYQLTKTSMVAKKLQVYEFEQKSVYNFSLLEHLLSLGESNKKLDKFIKQLADEEDLSWEFIDEFIDTTEYEKYFIKLLSSVWPNMWRYISQNSILTYERKIHYLSLIISNADIQVIRDMDGNSAMREFIEYNEDILQQLRFVDHYKVIAVIENLNIKFNKITMKNIPNEIMNYIFDNNCYIVNSHMIQCIVAYKNNTLISELENKNYTTIINLEYTPLINYVRENLTQYIKDIILIKPHAYDENVQIIDLLERSIDDSSLCNKIIEIEEFRIDDITSCCNKQIEENKVAVNKIWNSLLKNNRILPSWKNIISYWQLFGFTDDLVHYIDNFIDDVLETNSQHVIDDFIKELVDIDVSDNTFKKIISIIKMSEFDIPLNSIIESRISIMIECNYFKFTVTHYEELKNSFPDLCSKFILNNYVDYAAVIDYIEMESLLLESLLLSNRLEYQKAQELLDTFGIEYMTKKIAENLQLMKLNVNLDIFKAAWEYFDESNKQNFMVKYLQMLDADTLHSCFSDLGKSYSGFVDRSKQHVVEIVNTAENLELADKLKGVKYITSYQLKEKKEYDSVTETENIVKMISCRVKAVK